MRVVSDCGHTDPPLAYAYPYFIHTYVRTCTRLYSRTHHVLANVRLLISNVVFNNHLHVIGIIIIVTNMQMKAILSNIIHYPGETPHSYIFNIHKKTQIHIS